MSNAKDEAVHRLAPLFRFVEKLAYAHGLNPQNAAAIFNAILEASTGKGLSDEDLAGMFGLSQAEIRKILRILYDNGLAKYRRGRHPQTGATRYFWYIDIQSINNIILARKKIVLARLRERLRYERENEFYYCPNHRERYTFDEAFYYQFTCPKCGAVLELYDNSERIKILEEYVRRLEEEIRRDEEKLRAR